MVKPEMGDKGGSSTDEEVRDDVMIRNIEVRGEEVKVNVIVIVIVIVKVKVKVKVIVIGEAEGGRQR